MRRAASRTSPRRRSCRRRSLRAPAYGVWAADIDTDGDLDSSSRRATARPWSCATTATAPSRRRTPFASVTRVRGFAWADFDGEGVPDAALLDEARRGPRVPQPARRQLSGPSRCPAPRHRQWRSPPAERWAVRVRPAGAVARRHRSRGSRARPARARGTASALARVDPPSDLAAGSARLLVADLDNNGAPDLIVARPPRRSVLLGGPGGRVDAARRAGGARRAAPSPTSTATAGSISSADCPTAGAGRAISHGTQGRTTGRSCARARRRRPATSGSTRSASAARSRCAPGLHVQKQADRRPRSCTSAWARPRAPTSSASSGRTACCSRSSTRSRRRHGDGHAAAQGIVPVAVRVERPRDGVRHRPASGARRSACASTRRRPPTC